MALFCLGAVGCKTSPARRQSALSRSARSYMARRQYPAAIIQYRNAVKLNPRSASLQYALGKAYLDSHQTQAAYASFRRTLALQPSFLPAQLALAHLYLLVHQPGKALKLTRKILQQHPGNAAAVLLSADGYVARGNVRQAEAVVQAFLKKTPGNAAAHEALGVFYIGQRHYTEAKAQFQATLALQPDSITAHRDLAGLYRLQNDPSHAEKIYQAAIALKPKSLRAREYLVQFYLQQNRLSDAENILQSMLPLERQHSFSASLQLASLYFQQKHLRRALALDRAIVSRHPNAEQAAIQAAQILAAQGHLRAARAEASKLLLEYPTLAGARLLLAQIALARHHVKQARALLVSAKAHNPSNPAVYDGLGMADQQMGRLNRAQQNFLQAIRIQPHNSPALLALARIALIQRQPAQTVRFARALLAYDPDNGQAHLYAGSADNEMHAYPQAIRHLELAASLLPQRAAPLARLAAIYLEQHRDTLASQNLRQSLQRNPDSLEALNGIAVLDHLQNRDNQAIGLIERRIARHETAPLDNLLAQLYIWNKQIEPAQRMLRRSLRLEPNDYKTYILLGTLEGQLQHLPAAISAFQRAASLNTRSASLRSILGMLEQQTGNENAAVEDYRQALHVDSQNSLAANNLAWLYCKHKVHLNQALVLAQRASRLMPGTANMTDTLGWVYYTRGLYGMAVLKIRQAVRQAPRAAIYRVQLARALYQNGQHAAARSELATALRIDPQLHARQDVVALLGKLHGRSMD